MVVCTGEDIVFLATDINLAGAVDWVMMQTCFGHHFMLVLEKQERGSEGSQMFYTVVQLVGSRKQAENFAYRSVGSHSCSIVTYIQVLLNSGSQRNIWSMKGRVPGQEVDQRKLGERLWKKTVKHVDWIGRMPWIVVDGGSR